MAISRGFEPLTHSLEGCCSIQLSYETIKSRCKKTYFFYKVKIKNLLFIILKQKNIDFICGTAMNFG